MAGDSLGLTESVSIALGGMIGGGIFAVLGVVAQITHAATWFAFVVAGVVAACAGYSYNKLNDLADCGGGSVSFVQSFVGSSTLAGMTGWTLLFGYVGSMAMYAYAFGSFATGLLGTGAVAGVPLRPVVSVAMVAGFVGLNLVGARATGSAENVLVALKVGILLVFGAWGLVYGIRHGRLAFGFGRVVGSGPVVAAAVSFVAFQGWQLLFYDRESVADPETTIPRAVYAAIAIAVGIYVVVAVTTVSLAPASVVRTHPERALAVAAKPFLGDLGFTLVSLAALFSTGSAINATLFSAGYFAKGMVSSDLLPDRVGDAQADGVPARTLLVLGAVTAAFAAYGSLGGITAFASLSFIVVFGGVSYLALRQRDSDEVLGVVPAVGVAGTAAFFPLMFWHLWRAERGTFYAVVLVAAAVLAVELLYFERHAIEREIERFEPGAD